MLDVLETRALIEPHLASLAARRITVDQLDALKATVKAMRAGHVTSDTFQALAREFHTIVAAAANSSVLSLLASGLHKIGGGDVVGIEYGPLQVESTAAAHERITAALEARDSELAADLWSKHLRDAERYWKKAYADESARPVSWTI